MSPRESWCAVYGVTPSCYWYLEAAVPAATAVPDALATVRETAVAAGTIRPAVPPPVALFFMI